MRLPAPRLDRRRGNNRTRSSGRRSGESSSRLQGRAKMLGRMSSRNNTGIPVGKCIVGARIPCPAGCMSNPTGSVAGGGLSRFADTLSGISPTFDLLYGTHICDLHRARAALEGRRLRTSACDKFKGDDLLYVFYGKPSYRPKSSNSGNRFAFNYPVCFVVNLSSVIKWRRIFPFDTGAFPNRYCEFLHEKMSLEDFIMPADCDSARRIVESFFLSNSDYYHGKPAPNIRARKTIESQSYYDMIRAFGSGQKLNGDDRLVAVEMQAGGDIELNTGTIVRLLIPDKAMELEDVQAALVHCAVPFSEYETGSLEIGECHGLINRAVRDINRL